MAKKSKASHPLRQVRQQARFDPQRQSSQPEMVDMVDPVWILKALGGMLLIALVCAYFTLCVLFSRAQWQLVLHPERVVMSSPASVHLPFQEVHFDANGSGQPQLDGWWIPAASSAGESTALVLHSGDGTMSGALPAAEVLHAAGLNVLLFDYRGYGKSAANHPTEAMMKKDAAAALKYLTTQRALPMASIVLYGTGAGGPLAVHLATQHSLLSALILQGAKGDFAAQARRDPRSGMVPFSLLFDQNFALAVPLRELKTPVLTLPPDSSVQGMIEAVQSFVHSYANRKDSSASRAVQ